MYQLFLLCRILRDLDHGFLGFLIHILAFPFSVDDLADVHPIEVSQLDERPDVRQIASGLPPRNGPGGHVKPLRQLLLGQSLFPAQALEKFACLLLVHPEPLLSTSSYRSRPGSTTTQSEKCRILRAGHLMSGVF